MQKLLITALAAVVTGAIVGIVMASSGDNSDTTSVTTPELTVPPISFNGTATTEKDRTTTTSPGSGEQTTTTNTAPEGSGGSTAPGNQSGGAAAPGSDTQGNDQPPPKGSPAERFERFCRDNPSACGR